MYQAHDFLLSSFTFDAGFAALRIDMRGEWLAGIEFLDEPVDDNTPHHPVRQQIESYLSHSEFHFDIPLFEQGTAFQRRVWQAMREIPSGQTRSYGDIARELKSSARAVGNACRRNPVPLVVPCHRVIGADGLGGFGGDAVGGRTAIKRWLLAHEGVML